MPDTRCRVLILDGSVALRAMLAGIVARQPGLVCAGSGGAARDLGLALVGRIDPDIVVIDGTQASLAGLATVWRARGVGLLVIGEGPADGEGAVAVERVARPAGGGLGPTLDAFEAEVARRLQRLARRLSGRQPLGGAQAPVRPDGWDAAAPGHADRRLIAIGASTGGTEATRALLQGWPDDLPPVVIVQHMAEGFSARYAARLDEACRMRVVEAGHGQRLQPGHAYIAPGGQHLTVETAGTGLMACVRPGERVHRHRPSVDVLFASVAAACGASAIGVMLTGMGADGAQGMRRMRDAGAHNLAQDEASCAIFGMPRAAIAAGACHEVLPLEAIGPRVRQLAGRAAAAPVRPETAPAGR